MRTPKFTMDEVKYAEDPAMFARAEALFHARKVRNIKDDGYGYFGVVQGTHPYEVSLSYTTIDRGSCTCYMGENDLLCKHMLALALAVLDMTGGLQSRPPLVDLKEAKRKANEGMRKLRAYSGPSSMWFTYQRGLATGAGMITDAVGGLPATQQNADYLWSVVLRICRKLAAGGIDDSDGVVGNCVDSVISQIVQYAKNVPDLRESILKYCSDDTGFGFEDELRSCILRG